MGLKCPNRECGATYPVGLFASLREGEQFHIPCQACEETFLTLRDTFVVLNKNTYPVKKIQEQMRKESGKYETWINTLKAAYQRMGEVASEVYDDLRVRESTLAGGKGSKRDIKMRMSVQTPEEAIQEMRPVLNTTGRTDKFSEMSAEQLGEFFADPEPAKKYKG